MSKRFKISEEQYMKALSEGITLNADVDACNGDVKQAVDNTKQDAKQNGLDLNNVNIQVPAVSKNEGRIITKKELFEDRLQSLKANSKLYSLKDFINNIK